ncbi:hypothetical protein ACOQFO_04075 [Ureibacillus sp. MALMAid1270]|uniref:hypothetical protein n=1 Tax=Ureibacillus sp. MALMAid1270 TaxID=3411629 RepID=UPI003BA7F672
MKRRIGYGVLFVATLVFVLLFVFSNNDFKKFETLQEAIEKGIPYKVNNIVHTDEYEDVTIVMYTTNPEEPPTANYEALAVAFIKGSDDEGWQNIGHHGWTHYENDNMTVYLQPLRINDDKGNTLNEFYVVFGEVNNPEIEKIETSTQEDEKFNEAKMITANGNRYYFQIGREPIVRGLSKNGTVIDRQGG